MVPSEPHISSEVPGSSGYPAQPDTLYTASPLATGQEMLSQVPSDLWVLMGMKVLVLVILLCQIYIIVRGMHQIPMHIKPAMGQVQGVYHPQIPIIPGSLVVFLR